MPKPGSPAIADVDAFPDAREHKRQLRFLTCGSVDDGKSTVLDSLVRNSKATADDHSSVAEPAQGNPIDVAYRSFETDRRTFIAADTPGHEQYTRNIVTAASTAELAVVLVDARKGVLAQTRRHSHIVSLLGIRHLVLAVNKMDLVGYDQEVFERIATDYRTFADTLGFAAVHCVPLSALTGENVTPAPGPGSGVMNWYNGPPLMEILETIEIDQDLADDDFRLPVQGVNQPSSGVRGFSGTIAAGRVDCGDSVAASLSGQVSRVARLIGPAGDLPDAAAGQDVTLVLEDDIDIGRGELISAADSLPEVADQFAAHLIWIDETPMLPERSYEIRLACATATAQVTDLSYRIDVDTQEHLAAKTLALNEIGYCKIALDRAVAFDAYSKNRQTGGFVLIDKLTDATVGAGTISFALRRASNIKWHEMRVDQAARARANEQRPCVLWFTGLSGAGKSTVADRLEHELHAVGKRTYLLDGDNVRHGLNKDLGFTDQDRVENIRRVAEVARLMCDAGLIVLVSFISPFRSERQMARALMADDEFLEIFVDAPLEICEERDPKGLYRKARAGELKNFTGIDSDYETPLNAEITLKSGEAEPRALVDQVIEYLRRGGRI